MTKTNKLYFVIAFLFILITIASLSFTIDIVNAEDDSLNIYVNGAVKKTGNGSIDSPFKTIKEAKDYVKTLPANKNINVIISDGIYELDESLVFGINDFKQNATITYKAAQGAHPVLSGGKHITSKWTSEGNGIYSTTLDRNKKLRSLYVNGKRCYMTCNTIRGCGAFGEYEITEGEYDWAWADGVERAGVYLEYDEDNILLNTRNQDDIELVTRSTWNTNTVCVDHFEENAVYIMAYFQMPYGAIAQTVRWGNEYTFNTPDTYIYNVFEWLDEPGEFYFDKTSHKLYYYPREDEDLNTADVVVPNLENIVSIEGTDNDNLVKNLTFDGLTFAYTDWNLHEVGGSYGRTTNQAAAALTAYAEWQWHEYIYRAYDLAPCAFSVTSATNITISNCSICHTGNDGLDLINAVSNTTLVGNSLYDTAGAALIVGHPQHMYIGDKDSDKGNHSDKEKYDVNVEAACTNIDIENNQFSYTSQHFYGDPGIVIYTMNNSKFEHNTVQETPYAGISIGWGWWNMNGDDDAVVPGEGYATCHDNSICYNKFLNTLTVLNDAGAIYTLGDMPGTVISENYIKNVGTESSHIDKVRGIHVDEGTKNVLGERNVIDIDPRLACIDCGDWGRKGPNTWRNNYSTSARWSTEPNIEPGTVCENLVVVTDGNWNEEALSVINNAGVSAEYMATITERDNAKPSYFEEEKNLGLIIGLSVAGGVLVLAAIGVTAYIVTKKKKKQA